MEGHGRETACWDQTDKILPGPARQTGQTALETRTSAGLGVSYVAAAGLRLRAGPSSSAYTAAEPSGCSWSTSIGPERSRCWNMPFRGRTVGCLQNVVVDF